MSAPGAARHWRRWMPGLALTAALWSSTGPQAGRQGDAGGGRGAAATAAAADDVDDAGGAAPLSARKESLDETAVLAQQRSFRRPPPTMGDEQRHKPPESRRAKKEAPQGRAFRCIAHTGLAKKSRSTGPRFLSPRRFPPSLRLHGRLTLEHPVAVVLERIGPRLVGGADGARGRRSSSSSRAVEAHRGARLVRRPPAAARRRLALHCGDAGRALKGERQPLCANQN